MPLVEKGTGESGQHTARDIGYPISLTLLMETYLWKDLVKGKSCMPLSNCDSIIYKTLGNNLDAQ